MKATRTLFLMAVVLLTSACASPGIHRPTPPEPVAVEVSPPSAAVVVAEDTADAVARDAAGIEIPAVTTEPQPLVSDPWEGFNRKVHGFNNVADRYVLRPLAVGYVKVAPEPVQSGVSRFFSNLKTPGTAINQALQGRPSQAAQSVGRFVVNSTVGLVGIFDPASHLGLRNREHEDFGQTLAQWGWSDSRYLVLPLLGPRTVRDTVGILGDRTFSATGQINDSGLVAGLQVTEVVETRARLLPVDDLRLEAIDDYLFVRDAWAQRRKQQIQRTSSEAQ